MQWFYTAQYHKCTWWHAKPYNHIPTLVFYVPLQVLTHKIVLDQCQITIFKIWIMVHLNKNDIDMCEIHETIMTSNANKCRCKYWVIIITLKQCKSNCESWYLMYIWVPRDGMFVNCIVLNHATHNTVGLTFIEMA